MLNKILHRRGWSWYTAKTPKWLHWLYPTLIWHQKTDIKEVFITFDDGPIPTVTEYVLDTLKLYNAKASFFCIGNNVKCNQSIYQKLLQEGHAVGNHTQQHVNGWKCSTNQYIQQVLDAAAHIESKLFRPPYGRIKRSQINEIKKLGYTIIMWDVLSGDFDQHIAPQKCYENVIRHIKPGSIIVFHDSIKAFPRLQYALPKTLQWLQENGYSTSLLHI